MADTMQLFIVFILISFSGGSIFIGFPKSNWTTSSQVCSIPGIDNINNTDIYNIPSQLQSLNYVGKAWTGTAIKYTKWAAFIGCARSFSPKDSGKSVKAVEDCLKHCSDDSSAVYFAIKRSTCYCLTDKPAVNGDVSDCRKSCANAIETPCSSGRSALVFTFVKEPNIKETNTYIEKECLTTTKKDKKKFVISDCNAENVYGCTNTSAVLTRESWYDYQELCLIEGKSVLFDRNTIGDGTNGDIPLWTPIFRSHTVVTGKIVGTYLCLAVSTAGTKNFTVENCSSEFPFLCSQSQIRNEIDVGITNKRFPRFIILPTSVIVAAILLVVFLIFLIVIISVKSFRRIRIYQEKLKTVNERLPGTEFSNYTGIEDTNEEINNSGYKELSNILSHERETDTSEDTMDYQGYLVPEQHYHTIPEVDVHYAEANVAEDKEHSDKDDYLEPVT